MKPLISVIVPVYNAYKTLEFCVNSIRNQTYRSLEIILVDDGSSDGSGKLCDLIADKDSRIKVVHQKNEGVSAARNKGLNIAQGEFIGFVDADDWLHPEMYERLYDIIIDKNAMMACCGITRTTTEKITEIKNERETISEYNQDEYDKRFFKIGYQEIVYYIWNRLYRKEIVTDELFPNGISIGEDVVATYKVLSAIDKCDVNKIVETSMPLYYYRLTSGVTSHFSNKYFDLINVWDIVDDLAEEKHKSYVSVNKARIRFTILSELALSGAYRDSIYSEKIKILLSDLKANKKMLMEANISFSRKVLINLFCINYRGTALFINKLIKRRQ